MPFVSYLFARWGQIIGTPENCRRLLEDEEAILVFPEGARGISKPFTQRYQLQEFGLGFMRLALETQHADRAGRGHRRRGAGARGQLEAAGEAARRAGVSGHAVPAVLPAPAATRRSTAIYFGEPLRFDGRSRRRRRGDRREGEHVRNQIQTMIRVGLQEREHVFW